MTDKKGLLRDGSRLAFLRRREAVLPPLADERQLDFVAKILEDAEIVHDDTFLVFTGDKRLLFSSSGRSFLMFGVKGRAWVAMGGPIGVKDEATQLETRFIEMARTGRAFPSFYAVDEAVASRLSGRGFTPHKVGERAIIDLQSFSLSGKARQDLRSARNRAQKAGCRFEVCDPSLQILASLKSVSDKWLAMRAGEEKGFSLGQFDEVYLARFKLAVVFRQDEPIAFANIWMHQNLVALDMMRFQDYGPGGGMDYLFSELALWSEANGFCELHLGSAPLAGLQDIPNPTTVARLGAFVYARGGRFYGFEGLRAFKDKFDPTWEPSYICESNQWRAAASAVAVASLTGGGLRQIVRNSRSGLS